MRILLLTHNRYGLGGSYHRAFGLARGLAQRGHQVTLYAASESVRIGGRSTLSEGVEIRRSGDLLPGRLRQGGLSPFDAIGRIASLRIAEFDLAHTIDHRPSVSLPGLWLRRRGIHLVADWADRWGRSGIAELRNGGLGRLLGLLDDFWEQRYHASVPAATVACSALRELLVSLGVAPDKILDLPPGANIDLIWPRDRREMWEVYGLPPEALIAVRSGVSTYDDGFLAQSASQLAKMEPRFRLLMIGGPSPAVESVLRDEGFSDRMLHFGHVPYHRLGELLACGDLMMLPYRPNSVNEQRFPNRFGDYLAAGRPILSHPTGDLGMVLKDGRVGLAVEDSPQAYAEAAYRLLGDEDLRAEMGANARRLAEEHYAWPRLAKQVELFYRRLLDEDSIGVD